VLYGLGNAHTWRDIQSVVLVSANALINKAFYKSCFIKYSRIKFVTQLDSIILENSNWWIGKWAFPVSWGRMGHAKETEFIPMVQQPLEGQDLLFYWSFTTTDTPHLVQFFWTNDQHNAKVKTCRPTPWIVQSLELDEFICIMGVKVEGKAIPVLVCTGPKCSTRCGL